MDESRRSILWLALGTLLLTLTTRITPQAAPPDIQWPAPPRRARETKSSSTPPKNPSTAKNNPPKPASKPSPSKSASPATMPAGKKWFTGDSSVHVISRKVWADQPPIMDRIDPMGSVNRITIHHEGWNPVNFTDVETTAERLELIRRSHINRLKSGDIGYHFVVDRAGRVWQAREARYQGAHVRSNNEHNIGVMCLGNFDVQSPTPAQLKSLLAVVKSLQRFYKVPASKVKTHREINPTDCPGTTLQAFIVKSRKNKSIA